MAKQIISSFKELQGLIADVELIKEVTPAKSTVKNTQSTNKKTKSKLKSENQSSLAAEKRLKQTIQAKVHKPQNKTINNPKLKLIVEALDWLKATFPKAFMNPPNKVIALKIGIGHDIINYTKTQTDASPSLTSIRKALSMYTHNFRYLVASAKIGNPRIDLQGHIVGQISKEQAAYAKEKLNIIKAQHQQTSNADSLLEPKSGE